MKRNAEKNVWNIWSVWNQIVKKIMNTELDAVGVVEVILILVGIFTPYYGVGIRCMA